MLPKFNPDVIETRTQMLLTRLREGMSADWRPLSAAVRRAEHHRGGDAEWVRLSAAIEASVARRAARVASVPAAKFPPELPVSAQRETIAKAISENQIIIVCGETGSGKT